MISLCFLAATLAGAGCGSGHPDLEPGDTLSVDDLLDSVDSAMGQSGPEGSGQLIGGLPTNAGGSGGTGGAGGGGPPPAFCGNGLIEGAEQCDGASTGPANCGQLGFSGGTLLCDPATCTFDDSMCFSGAGGVGGGAGN
jgi:hypothetical protein